MSKIIKKINMLILTKITSFFGVLLFILLMTILISQYFLFSTVSYIYSIKKNQNLLNKIIVENMDKKVQIFKIEREIYKKEIGKKIVGIDDDVLYLTPKNIVKNLSY